MLGAKSPQELEAWQLCGEFRVRVAPILERPAARANFDWCRSIRKSTHSAPDLIAEGFGRFNPADSARYVVMAKAVSAISMPRRNSEKDISTPARPFCMHDRGRSCRLLPGSNTHGSMLTPMAIDQR